MEDKKRLQAHGITVEQMEQFGYNQRHGQVKYSEPNLLDTVSDPFWKEDFKDYKVAEHDAMHYHVIQEGRLFDQATGQRRSKARVQIYPADAFAMMMRTNGFTGLLTHIVHDPTKKVGDKEEVKLPELGSPMGAPQGDETKIYNFADLDEAKKAYKELTGKAAHHTWTLEMIVEKLKSVE